MYINPVNVCPSLYVNESYTKLPTKTKIRVMLHMFHCCVDRGAASHMTERA